MAFFNQMPNAGGIGMGAGGFGMGGSPSAFTSPGLDPMTLALLLRMQGAGGMGGGMGGLPPIGGPQMPAPPGTGGPQSAVPMGGMGMGAGGPGMQQPGGGLNMLSLFNSLGGVQGIQKLLPMLGIGGGTNAAAPFNAFGPGNFGAVNPIGAAAGQGIMVG